MTHKGVVGDGQTVFAWKRLINQQSREQQSGGRTEYMQGW